MHLSGAVSEYVSQETMVLQLMLRCLAVPLFFLGALIGVWALSKVINFKRVPEMGFFGIIVLASIACCVLPVVGLVWQLAGVLIIGIIVGTLTHTTLHYRKQSDNDDAPQ